MNDFNWFENYPKIDMIYGLTADEGAAHDGEKYEHLELHDPVKNNIHIDF